MAELHLYAAEITASFTILLTPATAQVAALLKQAQEIFEPLPKEMETAEFPTTRERVELGRSLFFDPRLAIDSNMSCSSCHRPAFFGTDALPKAIGVKQRPHPCHVPTNLDAGTSFVIHWRGDRTKFENHVFQALTSPITSGQPDEKVVIDRLARLPGYAPLFKAVFPDEPQPMTLRNIAKAVGDYERTLVTPPPSDAYLAGNQEALSPAARADATDPVSARLDRAHGAYATAAPDSRISIALCRLQARSNVFESTKHAVGHSSRDDGFPPGLRERYLRPPRNQPRMRKLSWR
jgi:cytochrome c peroxidase